MRDMLIPVRCKRLLGALIDETLFVFIFFLQDSMRGGRLRLLLPQ
jgi:hypothetical protein